MLLSTKVPLRQWIWKIQDRQRLLPHFRQQRCFEFCCNAWKCIFFRIIQGDFLNGSIHLSWSFWGLGRFWTFIWGHLQLCTKLHHQTKANHPFSFAFKFFWFFIHFYLLKSTISQKILPFNLHLKHPRNLNRCFIRCQDFAFYFSFQT